MISAEAFLQHNPVVLQTANEPYAEAASSLDAVEETVHSMSNDSGHDEDEMGIAATRRCGTTSRSARFAGKAVTADSDDVDACREAALRLLDAAPRSSGALHDRLLGKGYTEDVVDSVIQRLIAVQLINDHDYAESVVRVCANRMMGRRGAMMELARKGVDRALAAEVTDEAEQNGVFEEAAWELGRRVARKTEGLDRQVRQRRFWSAGGRKGHNPAVLREVAAELLN